MIVRIEKKALARAQRILKTVVPTRTYRPALGTVLIRDGYAYGTNLEHTVKVAVAPGPQMEPPFLVPWSAFKTLKGDVDITPMLTDRDKPKVKISGVLLEGFEVDEYPTLPEPAGNLQPLDDMNRLLLHLRRCDVVRAKENTARALLTGIGVFKDGALVATDGFRAYWNTGAEGRALAAAVGGNGVLPGEAATILSTFGWNTAEVGVEKRTRMETNYAGGKKADIERADTRWYFTSNGEGAWLRGLEGAYFAVRDLVPKEFPRAVTVNRRELLQVCEQAGRVVIDAPHPIVLQVAGGVRVYAKQLGNEFDSDLHDVGVTGEAITVGFNAEQMQVALAKIADGLEEVTLELSGVNSLARIAVDGGVYAQMPLNLGDEPTPPERTPAELPQEQAGEPPSPEPESAEPEPGSDPALGPVPEPTPEPAPADPDPTPPEVLEEQEEPHPDPEPATAPVAQEPEPDPEPEPEPMVDVSTRVLEEVIARANAVHGLAVELLCGAAQ
jgi:DNA polymerase III sliding clamp (beta) subunit (PCNA family)